MLRLSDGLSARTVKRTGAVFFLPAFAWCLAGYAARAEQPAMAPPQWLGAPTAPARPDLAAGSMPRASLNADLNASADYYRGYRDALRDAARLSRPYAIISRTSEHEHGGIPHMAAVRRATGSTTDARQREAAPRTRAMNRRRCKADTRIAEQHEQASPRYSERRTERLLGRASDPLPATPERRPEERRPVSAPPGAADSRIAQHPLPMPQSSLPQSYMLQPPPLQSQATPSQLPSPWPLVLIPPLVPADGWDHLEDLRRVAIGRQVSRPAEATGLARPMGRRSSNFLGLSCNG